MFFNCYEFNQQVEIPDKIIDCTEMFNNCYSLNQEIKIPRGTKSTMRMFANCISLKQCIYPPASIERDDGMFENCPITTYKLPKLISNLRKENNYGYSENYELI